MAMLERAGEGLAAMGEGGAHKLTGLRICRRPVPMQPQNRRIDPRTGAKDRSVDLSHQLDPAGDLGQGTGRAVGAISGAARSRSAISRCTITVQSETVGSSSIVRKISGVATE